MSKISGDCELLFASATRNEKTTNPSPYRPKPQTFPADSWAATCSSRRSYTKSQQRTKLEEGLDGLEVADELGLRNK